MTELKGWESALQPARTLVWENADLYTHWLELENHFTPEDMAGTEAQWMQTVGCLTEDRRVTVADEKYDLLTVYEVVEPGTEPVLCQLNCNPRVILWKFRGRCLGIARTFRYLLLGLLRCVCSIGIRGSTGRQCNTCADYRKWNFFIYDLQGLSNLTQCAFCKALKLMKTSSSRKLFVELKTIFTTTNRFFFGDFMHFEVRVLQVISW